MKKNPHIAIFISGRGSNMRAIHQAFPDNVVLVLSHKENAEGLIYAEENNIKTEIIAHKNYSDRETFEKELITCITHHNIDLICLAGFMRILSPYFIENVGRPVMNIHPSILPDFKGLNPQKQALEAGVKKAGCSVHLVTAELDGGPVLVQREVPVYPDDTVDMLSQRILEQEHLAYPEAVALYIQEKMVQS